MLQAPAAPTDNVSSPFPTASSCLVGHAWLQPQPSHPGVGTAPGAGEAEHTPCTIPCLPHTFPEVCWEQTNSGTGRIRPHSSGPTTLHQSQQSDAFHPQLLA